MKIIRPPYDTTKRSESRHEWVACFKVLLPSAREVSTGYAYDEDAVRFRLPSGAVLEWQWCEQTPAEAFQQAIAVGDEDVKV